MEYDGDVMEAGHDKVILASNGPSWAEISTFGGWAVLTVLPTLKDMWI